MISFNNWVSHISFHKLNFAKKKFGIEKLLFYVVIVISFITILNFKNCNKLNKSRYNRSTLN